jgi:hypothetical protein
MRPKPAGIPNETSPLPGAQPIACATKMTMPSMSANNGMNHLDLVICIEHRLHGGVEEAGEGERERQRRRVPLLLDRVDRLPRHRHRLRQLALRELPRRAELAHPVPHLAPVKLT